MSAVQIRLSPQTEIKIQLYTEDFEIYKSQANKSLRRIPWCSEAMKGVATGDTFRGTGSKF